MISSKAEHPKKNKSQKKVPVSKPGHNVCTSKEQFPAVSISHDSHVNQCVVQEDQDKTSQQKCPAHVISLCDDKNCQSTLCCDKNCQVTQCVHMWPVKPARKSSHMWSVEPAMPQSSYKKKDQVKQVSLCDDKNCQSTKCIHMWPVKSAVKSSHIQSVEPAMPQYSYKMQSHPVKMLSNHSTDSRCSKVQFHQLWLVNPGKM